jgi:peptidoglycan/xylan/chitin deacetylase (PgdA/CDA1 family)
MKYFVQMPSVLKFLFPKIIWKGEGQEKVIYLTFDDGPNAEITPKILSLLGRNHIKATFFCLGENVKENRIVYNRIIEEGHAVGNHSYAHPEAWELSHDDFIKDVKEASTWIDSKLFRPPYGRLKWSDYKVLNKKFKIVLWTIMPGDWDENVDKKILLRRMKKHLSPGAIYVFGIMQHIDSSGR